MKMLRNLVVMILVLPFSADAQNDGWNYINTYDGVLTYWRVRQDPGTNLYVAELKFKNSKNYDVHITFNPRFVCQDGSEPKFSAEGHDISAGGSVQGSYDGMFYYPCDGGNRAPKLSGYKNLVVNQIGSLQETEPKFGNFQKELTYPDALSGKWILLSNAIRGCYNASRNESYPCPPSECASLRISTSDGRVFILERSDSPGAATFIKEGNTLTTSGGGKFNFSISNNKLTMTTDIPKQGAGCKFEFKYARND